MNYFYSLIILFSFNLNLIAQTPDLSFVSFETGFSSPTTITHAGDSRIFVLEQDGVIKIIESRTKNLKEICKTGKINFEIVSSSSF